MLSIAVHVCIPLILWSVVWGHDRRNAVTDPDRLWPSGIVPYTFHPGIDAYRRVHVMAGMKQIMVSTYTSTGECILFVPWTDEEDYIEIQFTDEGHGGATVGRMKGKQIVSIVREITQDTIAEVLLFVIGVYPEVSRADRDNVLEIIQDNINATYDSQFAIKDGTDTFEQPFDYDTVVMYGPYFGATNESMPTIKTKYDGFTIGQGVSMSSSDVNLVQHIYNCQLDSSHRVDILGPLLFECHFHFDLCNFVQNEDDDFDWSLSQGPSETPGTGPFADHSSGSGYYAVATAEGRYGQVAKLSTPSLPVGIYCVVTWLYVYGEDIGQFEILQTGDVGEKVLFSVDASTPRNTWYHGSVTVTASNTPATIVIAAVMGNGDKGDIAIDDVYIYKGECIDWF